jgi:HAD superfamily hydrolase (TIGR01509 family)
LVDTKDLKSFECKLVPVQVRPLVPYLPSGNSSVVERNLAKVDVAGSTPVSRSIFLSMKNLYKAVIFDLDGTLIDSMSIWRRVDKEFLGKRGIEVPEDLFDHLPQGNSYNQTAQYFKDRFNLPDSIDDIMNEWTDAVKWHYANDITLKPGADDVIQKLFKSGIPLAIGTSNHDDLTEQILKRHDLLKYFKTIVTGKHDMLGKPFPDIFIKASCELDIKPERCIVIEDTLNGVKAAKAAGMYAIAIYDADSESLWQQIIDLADFHAVDYIVVYNHMKELLNAE